LLAKASNTTPDTFYTSGAVALFSLQLQQLWPTAQPVLPL